MDGNMNKVLILLILFFSFNVVAEETIIPPENIVILNTKESTWTPTAEQVDAALKKVFEFIDNPSNVNDWQKSEIQKIKNKLTSYNVQFVGKEDNGNKIIWCNFFINYEERFDYWKKGVVFVLDGGNNFWQIMYDPKSDSCYKFYSNGYA